MVSITIPNIDENLKQRLMERAVEHGHSIEVEAREILEDALVGKQPAAVPDSLAAPEFAAIVIDRRRLGRPINDFDAQIAAITRARSMSLATRDTRDFAETGVQIIDPWQP